MKRIIAHIRNNVGPDWDSYCVDVTVACITAVMLVVLYWVTG